MCIQKLTCCRIMQQCQRRVKLHAGALLILPGACIIAYSCMLMLFFLSQAHVAFTLTHIIPRHTRWPYGAASQRWRINAAAISVLHAALTVKPHFHSGAALGTSAASFQ